MSSRKAKRKQQVVIRTETFPIDGNGRMVSELKRVIAYCLSKSWKPIAIFVNGKPCHVPDCVDRVPVHSRAKVRRGTVLVKYAEPLVRE